MTVRETFLGASRAVPAQRPVHSAASMQRERLRELVRRELTARYRGSVIGVAWSLLNPLFFMLVYTVVFSQFMRFNVPGTPYPVYLLSGLLAWNFFSQSLTGSAASILGNAVLVKKVAFPWVLLTIATVLAAFVNYLISMLLLVPLILFFHLAVGPSLVLLPALALITLALALGLGLTIAAANVYFRDIEYLVVILLQVWFFMTPLIYQVDQIIVRAAASHNPLAVPFSWLLYANPMTWIATSFQDTIAFHRWPTHAGGLLYSIAVSAVALVMGILVFRRLSRRFAEEL